MAALSCQSSATAVKQITSRHLTTPRTAVSTETAGYQYFISHLSLLDPHNSSYGYGHAVTEEGGGTPAQKCPVSHIQGDSCMHSHTHRGSAVLGTEPGVSAQSGDLGCHGECG